MGTCARSTFKKKMWILQCCPQTSREQPERRENHRTKEKPEGNRKDQKEPEIVNVRHRLAGAAAPAPPQCTSHAHPPKAHVSFSRDVRVVLHFLFFCFFLFCFFFFFFCPRPPRGLNAFCETLRLHGSAVAAAPPAAERKQETVSLHGSAVGAACVAVRHSEVGAGSGPPPRRKNNNNNNNNNCLFVFLLL